jgi:hypothetical protein
MAEAQVEKAQVALVFAQKNFAAQNSCGLRTFHGNCLRRRNNN